MGILDAPGPSRYGYRPAIGKDRNLDNGVWRRTFDAAVGGRESATARAVVLGDSITEGEGAATDAQRWVNRLAYGLQNRYPTSGLTPSLASQFLPPYHNTTTLAVPATTTGSPGTIGSFGWGQRASTFTASGQAKTWTVTGTSVDLWYIQSPSTGVLYTKVDGGSATTFTTTATPLADGKKTTISLGASGSHTLEVGWSSGGTVYIVGISVYNGDESKGIRLLESGRYGSFTTFMNQSWTVNDLAPSITTLQPALITVALGINDLTSSVASSTVKTNLQTGITTLGAACTVRPSFLLIGQHQGTGSYAEPWSNYIAAMASIAEADSGVAFLDLSARLPAVSGDALGLYVDGKHPSAKGHGVWAEHILTALTR